MSRLRRYPFQVQYNELCLHGEIIYNSKDYHVALLEPFYARNTGAGLMYMIPARYTTPIDTDREHRKDAVICLEERAEEELIEIYETYKDAPFEGYVDRLLLPHEESLCLLFQENFVSIESHEKRKREIKKQYVEGLITNKKQSQQIQRENRFIEEQQKAIKNSYKQYFTEHSIQIPRVLQSEVKRYIKGLYHRFVDNLSS